MSRDGCVIYLQGSGGAAKQKADSGEANKPGKTAISFSLGEKSTYFIPRLPYSDVILDVIVTSCLFIAVTSARELKDRNISLNAITSGMLFVRNGLGRCVVVLCAFVLYFWSCY